MAYQFELMYLDSEGNESNYTPMVVDHILWVVNNDTNRYSSGLKELLPEWPIERVDLEWFEAPLELAEKAYRAASARGLGPYHPIEYDALDYAEEAFDKYFGFRQRLPQLN